VTLVAELSLALWLLVVGVNERKWLEQARTRTANRSLSQRLAALRQVRRKNYEE